MFVVFPFCLRRLFAVGDEGLLCVEDGHADGPGHLGSGIANNVTLS